MPLDKNYGNYLPHNEARTIILDPAATGIDAEGNIRPLDFIADLSISCNMDDIPYLASINIGVELVTGIIMTETAGNDQIPILAFTVPKWDWEYGKPIFLTPLEPGYSGWVTPGQFNADEIPRVHSYRSKNESKLAERCLFRLKKRIGAVVCGTTGKRVSGLVTLAAGDGLTLEAGKDENDNDQIRFLLADDYRQSCANGINFIEHYQEIPSHHVGSIGGAYSGSDGKLTIIFEGPFTLLRMNDDEGKPIGAAIDVTFSTADLCDYEKPETPMLPEMPSPCETIPPAIPVYYEA